MLATLRCMTCYALVLAAMLISALIGLRRLAAQGDSAGNGADAAWVRFARPAFALVCLSFPLTLGSDLLQLSARLWDLDLPSLRRSWRPALWL